ncbi:hypothetical protein [Streptococcus sp. 20-1249]|uniref:hypothetical protein n=1 Tax=Streptococcus hepaticus TaxID=3349163 RepID=UPI0037488BF7
MKFLTEDDLRVEYHQFPFDTFTIKKEERLTPGARTFLVDRKIKIINENEVKPLGKLPQKLQKIAVNPIESPVETSWQSQSIWLDIRCQFLEIAFDLAPVDLVLAQELNGLERYLATILAGGECILLPTANGMASTEKIGKSFIHGNLSNVGMFLQTSNGRILTKLYPLYFHLEREIERLQLQDHEKLVALLNRLGQDIAYYFQPREELNNDGTNLT